MTSLIKKSKIHKHSVSLSLFIILILPAVLLASSSPGAATYVRETGDLRVNAFVPLRDPGRFEPDKKLAKGRFLVASRRLIDPNFRETVVLLIRYGQTGILGLVINRPLNVKLATVFPDFKELEQRNETLFLGGPVEPNKILFVVRSAKPPEDSMPVFGDVYISSSRKELRRMIKKADKDERFRIYAGYAGWAPKQLASERDRGDWHVLKADIETLFDRKPTEIWPELIQRVSANWVRVKTRDRSMGYVEYSGS